MNDVELYAKAGSESVFKLNEIHKKLKFDEEKDKELLMEFSLALIKTYVEAYHYAKNENNELNVDYTKEFDRPFVIEGDTKWFVDEKGNYTGEGITKDGHHVDDLVCRNIGTNDYDKYTNIYGAKVKPC